MTNLRNLTLAELDALARAGVTVDDLKGNIMTTFADVKVGDRVRLTHENGDIYEFTSAIDATKRQLNRSGLRSS